jgi:hypothetical protein
VDKKQWGQSKDIQLKAKIRSYTVIQNFGFPLPKHSRRQLLRKFRVQKFYPTSGFWTDTSGFRTETSGFRPETSGFQTETLGFFNRNFGCWFRDFLRAKIRNFKSIQSFLRSFGWAEIEKILEVSDENKLLCMIFMFHRQFALNNSPQRQFTIEQLPAGQFTAKNTIHSNLFSPETLRISPVSAQPKLRIDLIFRCFGRKNPGSNTRSFDRTKKKIFAKRTTLG